MSATSVGFIGLGNMGKPMASRLLGHGYRVVSCAHLKREAIEELKAVGLIEVSSPSQVAAAAGVVITMVRNTEESENLILGDHGLLAGMSRGSILIMMSTIDPQFCQRVATEAAARELAVLDAPVSGGSKGAEQGSLALMVGGDRAILERCRPVLEPLGRIFFCGSIGSGMVAKLANNAVLFGTIGLITEALAMARAHGMPDPQLLEVLQHATADSFAVREWQGMQAMWHHLKPQWIKDIRMCLETANDKEVKMPLTALTSHYPWKVP